MRDVRGVRQVHEAAGGLGRRGAVLLLLLVLLAELGAAGGAAGGAAPAFARRQQMRVRARPGAAAALRCRVLRLADRAVSWIRSSDLQILTHAGAVFTADARVSAITGAAAERGAGARDSPAPDAGARDSPAPDAGARDSPAPDAGADDYADDYSAEPWAAAEEPPGGGGPGEETVHTLHIERLRAADSGRYECQINTEPKMSLFFNLTVSEARGGGVAVRALGGRAVRGAAGGAALLACEARYLHPAPGLPPLRIRWYHAGRLLDDQSPPGGVALSAERWAGGARSRLSLGSVRRRHAGEWTCRVGAAADTLTLSLAPRGPADELEAMQHDQAEGRVSSAAPLAAPLVAPLVAPLAAPLAAALLVTLIT